jgi:hypothetical protein
MAEEIAAGGEVAAALSSDEFRRGMELAGIAGQVQAAAELLQIRTPGCPRTTTRGKPPSSRSEARRQ